MQLNISKVLNEPNSEFIFESKLDISDFEPTEGIVSFPKEVDVKLEIKNILQSVSLTLKVNVLYFTVCDRCAKDITVPIEFEFESAVKVGSELEILDDDILVIDSSDSLDLKELVINVLLMNLPMKTLCSEDCKGLCSDCGIDLNVSECDCKKNKIDPRLSALKKLLDK